MLRAFVVSLFVVAATAGASDADVLLVYGNLHGGGMVGKGVGGDQKGEAFFANAPNGTYGLSVAARFLFLAAEVSHDQYTFFGGQDQNSLRTWTQFSVGIDFDAGIGAGTPAKDGQPAKKSTKFIQFAAMAGFGVGTGQQVDPPLDNSEITDKGFMLGGKFGIGTHVNKLFDFGLMIPVQYGYFIKNGVAANDVSNHYQGIHGSALLFLRLNIKLL